MLTERLTTFCAEYNSNFLLPYSFLLGHGTNIYEHLPKILEIQ